MTVSYDNLCYLHQTPFKKRYDKTLIVTWDIWVMQFSS